MTGEEIRKARLAAGLGVRELGRRLECSGQHICDIEHGRRYPSHELAVAIAHELGINGPTPADSIVRTGRLPRPATQLEAEKIVHILGLPKIRKPIRL